MSASTESRARIARRRAASLGLRAVQRAGVIELRDAEGQVLVAGVGAVEVYLGERYVAQQPGPAQAATPPAWQQPIADYCLRAAAAGLTVSTIAARRKALARMGRELRCPPAEVTGEQLVASFGRQQWKPETLPVLPCRSA